MKKKTLKIIAWVMLLLMVASVVVGSVLIYVIPR